LLNAGHKHSQLLGLGNSILAKEKAKRYHLVIKSLPQLITAVGRTWPVVADATSRGNIKMLKSFLGPAYRGLFEQCAKGASFSSMNPSHKVHFDWQYTRDYPELAKLYNAANSSQWNATESIDWSRDVDPLDLTGLLLPDAFCPANVLPMWSKLSPSRKIEAASFTAQLVLESDIARRAGRSLWRRTGDAGSAVAGRQALWSNTG
jgi:hypothetical protein